MRIALTMTNHDPDGRLYPRDGDRILHWVENYPDELAELVCFVFGLIFVTILVGLRVI